jgi:hypothetical protein
MEQTGLSSKETLWTPLDRILFQQEICQGTCTLYLECSTDNQNWFELDNVALAGAADNQLWIDKNASYRWARLRYAFTAGVGTLNVHAIKKGDK